MASSRSSVRSRASEGRKRYGCEQPRIFTPPLRPLTSETSLGFAVIEFATDVLNIELFPWQRWLLIHALETLPDGSFRFRNVVVLVARQNGKSTLSQVLALFAIYVLGTNLVLGTAQDLDTAEEVWEGALDIIEETPELAELADKPIKVNGKKAIRLKTGERYKVKAATRSAGRGLSGDLIMLDELREHQSWDAWGAITKTTMARPNAQVWALSNAGDSTSVVLRYLRKMAHAAIGDPDGICGESDPASELPDDEPTEEIEVEDEDSLGIFEWSAPPGCDVWDRDGWAQANPSMGHTITERTISSAAKTDPEWVFRTEVLCQWSDGTLEGPFPPGSWDACRDAESEIPEGGEIKACLDVSWNRGAAHVAVAGLRSDGLPHVEVVASRAGTRWVVDWFTDEEHPHRAKWPIAVQNGSPAASLTDELRAAGLEVVEWKGAEVGRACGGVYDLVRDKRLRHRGQPVLDLPAGAALTRPVGEAWAWDRKHSPVDAAPMVAATGALWQIAPKPQDEEVDVWGFFS